VAQNEGRNEISKISERVYQPWQFKSQDCITNI